MSRLVLLTHWSFLQYLELVEYFQCRISSHSGKTAGHLSFWFNERKGIFLYYIILLLFLHLTQKPQIDLSASLAEDGAEGLKRVFCRTEKKTSLSTTGGLEKCCNIWNWRGWGFPSEGPWGNLAALGTRCWLPFAYSVTSNRSTTLVFLLCDIFCRLSFLVLIWVFFFLSSATSEFPLFIS